MDLSIGDVVRLNSGSTAMTVEAINGSVISCLWMSPDSQVQRDDFDRLLLTKITDAAR